MLDLSFEDDEGSGLLSTPPPRAKKLREPSSTSTKKTKPPETGDGYAARWKSSRKHFEQHCSMGDSVPNLQELTPHQKQLAKQTWLRMTSKGCQCIPCSEFNVKSQWAEGTACCDVVDFRLRHVKNHAKGKQHKAAVLALLGLHDGALHAPPLDDFKAMLHKLQRGHSSRDLAEHQKCSDKIRLMVWCLEQALLEEDRQVLAKSESICLMRDARKQRLLVRFGACSKETLECRSGVLGQSRNMGETAGNILRATRQIMVDFCASNFSPPRWYAGPGEDFDQELYDWITSHVEIVVSDAAAHELLATSASAGDRDPRIEKDSSTTPLFPCLKMIGRDAAHAYRKVLQRPYQADEEMKSVMEDFALSNDSMLQQVSHSHEMRAWFEEEILKMESSPWGKKCKNLKSAKHRFESHATPLGRLLMYFPAFLNVVSRIYETRQGGQGAKAQSWLSGLTSDRLLLVSMLSDAADEGLVLVRTVDREDLDLSELADHVQAFHDRIIWLFHQRHVVECGYTQYTLDMLADGSFSFFTRGAARRLKYPSDSVISTCVDRMCCWTKLAVEVLRAEFPHYSLFNAMSVFNLTRAPPTRASPGHAAQDMVERLAQTFKAFQNSWLGSGHLRKAFAQPPICGTARPGSRPCSKHSTARPCAILTLQPI